MKHIRVVTEPDKTLTVLIDDYAANLPWTFSKEYAPFGLTKMLTAFRLDLNHDKSLTEEERITILTLVSDQLTKRRKGKIQ